MNIAEKLLLFLETFDVTILLGNVKIERENLNVIVIDVLSWLKLERKREIWIEQGRTIQHRAMSLNMQHQWCKDLVKLVQEEPCFSEVFVIESDMLTFRNDISEEYIHEARRIAYERFNPSIMI
jgi:hypothetical protein